MPRIVCAKCGREVYTTWAFESLLPDERRCSNCNAELRPDRRDAERRQENRRKNPPAEPGPPDGGERRAEDRRKDGARRKASRRSHWDGPGWID